MKKILALVLALAMILMVGAVYADGETPTLPKADISISNLETNDEVTLYKIIKWNPDKTDANGKAAPDWDFNGITVTGYDTVEALVAALNGTDATAAMTALVNAVSDTQKVVNAQKVTGTSFTYNAEVGSYLALVKAAGATMYNPMVLSVNFTNPTTGAGGTLDADTAVTGSNGIAKKQPVTVNKEVEGDDEKHDVAVGDTVPFLVHTQTPNYGSNYTDPVFTITDTLSEGLTLTADQQTAIEVVVDGTDPVEKLVKGTDYTITPSTTGYTINFTKSYLLKAKANTAVTVKYTATVNEKAEVMHNVEQYDNDVDIVFSNSPSTTDSSLHDETHHYTFSIDASLLGSAGGDDITKELVKIGVDEDTNEVITSWKTGNATSWTEITPLQGAAFTLTGNGHTYEATSDGNGYLNFTGLDVGEYTLTEISAPAGYKFSTAGVPVVISATYNTDGTLNTYTIKINNTATSTYTATNEGGWTSSTTINNDADTTGIINEKGVTLPSTGGIGTTIFYILGGLLVIGAAVVLVARRKAHD